MTTASKLAFTLMTLVCLGAAPAAGAVDAAWINGSGDYDVPGNWDVPAVPCIELLPTTENVDMSVAGTTVSQNVSVCNVLGVTLGSGVTFSLTPDTAYLAGTGSILGTISGAGGDLSISSTAFDGTAAYVFATAGSDISMQDATSVATDTRFTSSGGAVVDIEVPAISSTGLPNNSVTMLSASGAGSRLQLPFLTDINAGFNSGTLSVQAHQIVASDGGVLDLSGLVSATGPVDDEDYLRFEVTGSGSMDLSSLQTVTAGGFVWFYAADGATHTLPSLLSTQDAVFSVDNGAQILADTSAWTFSSTGRPNSNTTLARATGPGTLVDLSGMTDLNAGFNSGTLSTQVHQVIAEDEGTVNLSGLTSVTGPVDDEDYLLFDVSGTASMDLGSLQTVTAGGYVWFHADLGASLTLPSLLSVDDAVFSVDAGSQILANATSWTFSSLGRPNSNSTLARATGPGTLVDLSGMTDLNAGFNSGTLGTQFHQVLAGNQGVVDLSGVTTVTGPVDDEDYLYFQVSDTATLDLSSVADVTAGGFVWFYAVDGGSLTLPSLASTLDAVFSVDTGGQIIANATDWTFSSTGRPNTNTTLVRATGADALVDLSGMTDLNAGFNSGTLSAQAHVVTADDQGTIDLSGLTNVTGPVDDEDYLLFEVTDTASIDLSNVQDVTAGGWVWFHALDGGLLALPSLQTAQDVVFSVDTGGEIYAGDSAWTWSSVGRPNSNTTIARATGAGTLLDLSGAATLNAGFNSGTLSVQVHSVVAETGGIVDISGVNTIIGPVDPEDALTFTVNNGGTLVTGPLDTVNAGGSVSMTLNAIARLEAPDSLDVDSTMSVIANGDNTIAVVGDFGMNHVTESRFNLETARVSVEGVETQTVEVGGFDIGNNPPAELNFGLGQLIVGSDTQSSTVKLIDTFDNNNGHNLCGGTREALYLYGYDVGLDADGLRILNGSTLNLGGLNLYASLGGTLTHINAMGTPGVPFAFDGGFIDVGTPLDWDEDGVSDSVDNCVFEPNPDQVDSDGDGYGNACDADLNGDVVINGIDLAALRLAFFSRPGDANWKPDADFNNDMVINVLDLAVMAAAFFGQPGPSCP